MELVITPEARAYLSARGTTWRIRPGGCGAPFLLEPAEDGAPVRLAVDGLRFVASEPIAEGRFRIHWIQSRWGGYLSVAPAE
jgi:hypothetical protein